jgi:hypothetical protein
MSSYAAALSSFNPWARHNAGALRTTGGGATVDTSRRLLAVADSICESDFATFQGANSDLSRPDALSRFSESSPGCAALADGLRAFGMASPGCAAWARAQVAALPITSCTLPHNPAYAEAVLAGRDRSGIDPYFASSADRDAWLAAKPGCSAPPFVGGGSSLPGCVLPTNSAYMGQRGVDPHFATAAEHDAWAAAHPGCTVPAFIAGSYVVDVAGSSSASSPLVILGALVLGALALGGGKRLL